MGKIVFTNGCFDLFHFGHLRLLQQAKALGSILIVGVDSDESIRSLKGNGKPIVPLVQRIVILAELRCVDLVVSFDNADPLSLIKYINPDILVKGRDYIEDEIIGAEYVRSIGGRVELIDLIPDISTSSIIKKINKEG